MSVESGETVRIGIIGPSWWVNYWHLPAIQNHPQAEIVGVSGEKPREEADVRAKYGAQARYFTDYETMLTEIPMDGVVVCTPNDTHHPATMAALQHNVHVTCEKPLALNAAQAQEMAKTARARQRIGMTNFPYRDNPAVQTFRRLMQEGFVGTPLHISGIYHGGFGLGQRPNWRGLRERSGAGILGDLGSHLIDLARFISGDEFTAVSGHTITALWPDAPDAAPELVRTEDPRVLPRNDDSCTFLAEFASGMQGLFHTSWIAFQGAMVQEQQIEIYGTQGRLHFYASHAGTCLRGMRLGEKRWETIPVAGIVLPAEASIEEEDYFRPGRLTPANTTYRFIEAIRMGQTTIAPDLDDGWRAQQVIDAVIQSSAERRWVAL
jgi:predicted dehydrogenase